jgi:polysaccharide biosynthesis protein PslA
MVDVQPQTLLLAPQRAGEWARRSRGAPSGRMVSDVVGMFDVLAVLGAGLVSYETYLAWLSGEPSADRGQYVLGAALAALLFAMLCRRQRAYRLSRLTDLPAQLATVMRNLLLTFGALVLTCFLVKISASFARGWVLLWIGSAATMLALARTVTAIGLNRLIRAGYLRRRRAVIGEGPALWAVLDALNGCHEEPAELVGVFPYGSAPSPAVEGVSGAGEGGDLVATLRALPLDEIIVAFPEKNGKSLKPLIDRLKTLPVDIRLSLPSIASQLPICGTSMIGPMPMIEVALTPLKSWHVLLKASFDRSLALLLLVLFWPLLLLIALLIKLDDRGPVFFTQERFGLNNRVIRVIKFRTMHVATADPSGSVHTVRGDTRITRVGRRLRAHSLDELPQLFNVLRGDMSLVGPRPHALAMKAGDRLYHEVVSEYFARHRVKPGMTGWAQVNGLRGEITSVEMARRRVEYDLHYIDHWSIWLDIKILAKSLKVMLETDNAF